MDMEKYKVCDKSQESNHYGFDIFSYNIGMIL